MNEPKSSSKSPPPQSRINSEQRDDKQMKDERQPDQLDSDYVARNSRFFTVGKVFSTLAVEIRDSLGNDSSKLSTVRFGQKVYSHIARFIVVQPARGFSYSCEIQTYSGRGTLRRGCNPTEHAIVYMQGDQPTLLHNEKPLAKQSIEIVPASLEIGSLARASRIRFGKAQPIQHNVKAKDIGHVRDEHIPLLVSYWRMEMGMDSDTERSHGNTAQCTSTGTRTGDGRVISNNSYIRPPSESGGPHEGYQTWSEYKGEQSTGEGAAQDVDKAGISHLRSDFDNRIGQSTSVMTGHQQQSAAPPRRDVFRFEGLEYTMITKVAGDLHSGFVNINKPKAFFKKGRVFMVLWPELAGIPESERTIYWEVRRFVVIRPRSFNCLCLSISTYQGKATTKTGISVHDHAAIIPLGSEVQLHPDETALQKSPLYIKVEDPSVFMDPMSRINFAKVSTLEYDSKVRSVGRIVGESIKLLEEYFIQTLQVTRA